LSDLNAVTTHYIADFMRKVQAGEGELEIVLGGLPISGQTGTLAWRFTGDNAVANGAVYAKTGMLEREWAMGGIIYAQDGTPLTFTVYAIGDGISGDAPYALDTVVTAAYLCGNNLSNY
jgi:D-alanyl-D-alanine carboxypeptidase/D-alanyl-D-alanine-endopeptidase (penicillin-binding protein 4)